MHKQASATLGFDLLRDLSVAHVIFAGYEAGFWDFFEADPHAALEPNAFSQERGLDARLVRGLLEYLARRQFLESAPDGGGTAFRLAEAGRQLVVEEWVPYFAYYVGGYANVLSAAGGLVTGRLRYGEDLQRDARYVAVGSELIARTRHSGAFEVVLDRARDVSAARVVDLGCGSAAFLVELVQATGAVEAIGIDESGEACDLSRRTVAKAALADVVRIVEEDARRLLVIEPAWEGTVDVMTAMFLVHEFFSGGMDRAAAVLAALGRALRPGDGRLLILDKHTDSLDAGEAPPYFTEFKLMHDLTGQVLYDLEGWHAVMERAGLVIVSADRLAPHTGNILLECRRR